MLNLAKLDERKTIVFRSRKYDAAFKEEVLSMEYTGRLVSDVAQAMGIE